ncbi:MAG: uracil-DNA glycosylase [Thermodesulfobacterium geofontis]|uniref:Type-4 uracil-DNA glycosylase n=1 Tax=Thermodesulfobacterium geofontis TaxID=1295609 RepID=A0A2N7PP94_9BACT|nr:MAG: uracil-DNA glycosylase [Thermodesulfobacterium geofontis]
MKEEKLKKINEEIKRCKRCDLWKLRNNAVPGEGPANAKIMIIGQAPGVQEDKIGRPFVGPAGKFLNYLLELAGLKREEIFITSPLKCLPQPPVNRKPKKVEIKACLPWLKNQVEIINPEILILLGEVAFSVFFPDRDLKEFRGELIKEKDKKFFVTYHPSAGLRFPKIRKILEADFKKLKNLFA